MDTLPKPNLFFNFKNKDYVSKYIKYLEMKREFERLDKLLEHSIISIDNINGTIIIHSLIKFCKYYFNLRYNLSAEFLVHATEMCRIFYRRRLEPEFNIDDIWDTIQRRKLELLSANTKYHVINELINKNLILKYDSSYKRYLLNIDNPNVHMLIEYLMQDI